MFSIFKVFIHYLKSILGNMGKNTEHSVVTLYKYFSTTIGRGFCSLYKKSTLKLCIILEMDKFSRVIQYFAHHKWWLSEPHLAEIFTSRFYGHSNWRVMCLLDKSSSSILHVVKSYLMFICLLHGFITVLMFIVKLFLVIVESLQTCIQDILTTLLC